MEERHTYSYSWNGIKMIISFQPNYSESYKVFMGEALGCLEVKAQEPLPITQTGYRRIFLSPSEVDENGGPVALIKRWLDEAGQAKEWKAYLGERQQYSLF